MGRIAVYATLIAFIGLGTAGYVLWSQRFGVAAAVIQFRDDAQTNSQPALEIADLTLLRPEGSELKLRDLLGEKHLVVVITRGNSGSICPYCSTQTSRLITNYPKFVERNAEVVVVYPVNKREDKPALDAFLEAVRKGLDEPGNDVPFPLALDVGLEAVDGLGIRAVLSKPATYILDKHGQVRFAYVGAGMADRPSVDALLKQLDSLD